MPRSALPARAEACPPVAEPRPEGHRPAGAGPDTAEAGAGAAGAGPGFRKALIFSVAGLVIVADQLSKTWALDHAVPARHVVGPLWLTLSFNRGAAFSLGAGVAPVIEAVVVLVVVGLLFFGRRVSRNAGPALVAGLGLLVGGSLGNLTDRLVRHHGGAVIDFIQAARIGDHDYWPIFNLADASVVIGAMTVALLYGAGRK